VRHLIFCEVNHETHTRPGRDDPHHDGLRRRIRKFADRAEQLGEWFGKRRVRWRIEPTGTMSARIDGVQWTAASAQGTINNGVVSIVGITAGQVFSIGVTVNRGPATYTAGIIDPFNVVVSNLTIGSSGWDAGP